LLVFYYLYKLRSRHRDQPPTAASYPGFIGRERAMVLIGLIIAVVLMALLVPGVSGIRWKPPVRNVSRRAGPGSARIPGR
jgi:hypothetical protein